MTQQIQNAQYDTFTVARTRRSSNGVARMPIAAPYPAESIIVALNGGSEDEMFAYVATRRGQPPIIPAPYSSNPNRYYYGGEQSAAVPIPLPGGIMDYALWGWFGFYILSPEGLNSDFYIGTVPFAGLDRMEVIWANYLSRDIINMGSPPPLQSLTPATPVDEFLHRVLQVGKND